LTNRWCDRYSGVRPGTVRPSPGLPVSHRSTYRVVTDRTRLHRMNPREYQRQHRPPEQVGAPSRAKPASGLVQGRLGATERRLVHQVIVHQQCCGEAFHRGGTDQRGRGCPPPDRHRAAASTGGRSACRSIEQPAQLGIPPRAPGCAPRPARGHPACVSRLVPGRSGRAARLPGATGPHPSNTITDVRASQQSDKCDQMILACFLRPRSATGTRASAAETPERLLYGVFDHVILQPSRLASHLKQQ